MGFWTRLAGRLRATGAPRVTLVENGRVTRRRATWADIERAIRGYNLGGDWTYFDLRFGDLAAHGYAIVSGKTRCADLFAVLVTFDGETFHSPEAEAGDGTYAFGASEVYPDARCVTTDTAFAVGQTFCERGELDAAYRWRAFEGTGYVTAQTPRELRDDADALRQMEWLRLHYASLVTPPDGAAPHLGDMGHAMTHDRLVRDTALLREAYAAFNARDTDAALATMSPGVAWPRAFQGGFVRGHDEVRAYWAAQWSEIDPRVEPVTFHSEGEGRILVEVHQVVRDLAGAVLADGRVGHRFTVAGGRIQSMEVCPLP